MLKQPNGTLDKGKGRENDVSYGRSLQHEDTIKPVSKGTSPPQLSPGPSQPSPLPHPPVSPKAANGSSTITASDLRTTRFPAAVALLHILRASMLPYLHDIARFLNRQFNLNLSTDFDIPIPDFYTGLSNIWYIIFVVVPLALFWTRIKGRPSTGKGLIAGDAARRKLKAQASRNALTVGPQLGSAFWKAAMTAVLDAVSMGGRGLI